MSIDLTLCAKRVGQILNAATRDGSGNITFVTTVEDARRNASNISAAVDEAALIVAQAYCETDSHPSRAAFISLTTVTHGQTLPAHYGPPGVPQIQPYNGAGWVTGDWTPAQEVESYRENPSQIYDSVEHNEEGSILAGGYDFVGDGIVFTGYAARVPLASFSSAADAASKLPASSEATVVRVAVGLLKMEGDSGVLDAYGAQGQSDLALIRSGGEPVESVEVAA